MSGHGAQGAAWGGKEGGAQRLLCPCVLMCPHVPVSKHIPVPGRISMSVCVPLSSRAPCLAVCVSTHLSAPRCDTRPTSPQGLFESIPELRCCGQDGAVGITL